MVPFEEEPPLVLVPFEEEPTPQVHQHPPEAAAGILAIDHLNGDDHLSACESPGCAWLGLLLPLPCQCKVLDPDSETLDCSHSWLLLQLRCSVLFSGGHARHGSQGQSGTFPTKNGVRVGEALFVDNPAWCGGALANRAAIHGRQLGHGVPGVQCCRRQFTFRQAHNTGESRTVRAREA